MPRSSRRPVSFPRASLALLGFVAAALPLDAQVGTVQSELKISETSGGFGGALSLVGGFGWSSASLGDLDGDGIGDLAVSEYFADDGGSDQGALWILFLNADGTVKDEQKISETSGGFGGVLDDSDLFGFALAALGDLDGDGIGDLAAGARHDDDGGSNQGAIWILFLDTDGTVKSEQKISETSGGFGGDLDVADIFGWSLAGLGDLDGDGIEDLAAGVLNDDDGAAEQGAVWILFLDTNGTVKSEQKISATAGAFGGDLDAGDHFGSAVATLGDLDGDGVVDLAVGAYEDDDGDTGQGAVWILFLDTDGTVKAEQKISETSGGFGGALLTLDRFGSSAGALGDLDGDGVEDLAVGALYDDDGGADQGAAWILFLDTDGTVKSEQKISETAGGFGGALDASDHFGSCVTSLGDLDGDGTPELVVGAYEDDDGGTNQGALWVLSVAGDTTPPVLACPPYVAARDAKGGTPGAIVTFTVTAGDDRDPAPAVVCVPPSGSFFPRGITLVSCTATDLSGNQSNCVFPVTVFPTVRPR